jgi:hypothetical protein
MYSKCIVIEIVATGGGVINYISLTKPSCLLKA